MGRIFKLLAMSLPLVLLAVPLATTTAAAESGATATIQGHDSFLFGSFNPTFKVNRLVRIPWSLIGGMPPGVPPTSTGFQETYGYHGTPVHVESGETLTVVNQTSDFHTFTVVNKSDLPKTLSGAFGCFASGPCSKNPPVTPTIGAVGDGAFVIPSGSFTETVTAPSGSVLYFMCLFHPEMQGKIIVGEGGGDGGDG